MKFEWIRKFNLKILAIGLVVFNSFDYAFDYVLYPFVIYKYGPLLGGIVMGILATVICLFILWVYDLLEKDWLGIEAVKELVENFFKQEEDIAKKSWRRTGKRMMYWLFHKNKIGQFLFLSIHFDPLITSIYMRPGYHLYNGLTRRDWKIFLGSTIVSNVWWTGIAFVAVSTLKETVIKFF
ncbi:MAG: hypothetical protein PHW24_00510 [Candidatus Moranbacteria bacterium]|nr:hypothetical protein [Candidatus Moranbacteria bacterium]